MLKRTRDYVNKLRALADETLSHDKRQKSLNDHLHELDDVFDGSVGVISLVRLQNLYSRITTLMAQSQ